MPEDASLDDFLSTRSRSDEEDGTNPRTSGEESRPADRDRGDGDSESGDLEDGNSEGGDDDGPGAADAIADATDDPALDSIEPAASTSQWVSDGTACPDCGGTVSRLWRDGDRLVCTGCKSWDRE